MTIFNKIYTNPVGKIAIYVIAVILLFFIASLFIRGCNDTPSVVAEHTNNRAYIMLKDSLQSAYQLRERKLSDSMRAIYSERLASVDTVYRNIVKHDTHVEYVYREKPSLENCDAALSSKNKRIAVLESQDSTHRKLRSELERTIVLQDTTINQKNKTIAALNSGYAQATEDLAKAKRKRPVAITVGPNYSIASDLKPRVGVGVQIGFKIAQF